MEIINWLWSRECFGDGGLPDRFQSSAPQPLVALIPLEIQQANNHADKAEQTEDQDDDIFIIHLPKLRAACYYVKS